MSFLVTARTAYRLVRNSARSAITAEHGSSLVEASLTLPFFVLLLIGAADFGRAWYLYIEVASAAEAGALYGVSYSTDISGMNAAALLDAPDIGNLHSSAIYGTECSDGSSPMPLSTGVPTCAINAISYVEVDTSATYKLMFDFPGVPSPLTISAKSRMRTTN